jgi:hypothetical protein
MRLSLPQGDHALLKVTAKAGNWSKKLCVGRPFTPCELVIDEGIDEREVEVAGVPCNRKGEAIGPEVLLKVASKVIKPITVEAQPQPPLEPKPKKKRAKRGQEIAPPKSADVTRSQASTDNDERVIGFTPSNGDGRPPESDTDDVLQMG